MPLLAVRGRRSSGRGGLDLACARLCQDPLAAAWYCSTTLAGMRPRSLTAMPWPFAHARISPLRSRRAAVRPGRRRCPRPALRACSMKGASCFRNALAFLVAQIDLVLGTAQLEPHRLIGRAAIEIVDQSDGYLLSHLGLPSERWVRRTIHGPLRPHQPHRRNRALSWLRGLSLGMAMSPARSLPTCCGGGTARGPCLARIPTARPPCASAANAAILREPAARPPRAGSLT